MDEWTRQLSAVWTRATTSVGGWGLWSVRPVEASYSIVSQHGRTVATTAHKPVADLIAAIPDLMEPTLRPGQASTVGVSDPDNAHEEGWKEGHAVGTAEAYADADTLVQELLGYFSRMDDPNVQAVTKAATEHWAAITEGLPTHEGEVDPYETQSGGDPRPVC